MISSKTTNAKMFKGDEVLRNTGTKHVGVLYFIMNPLGYVCGVTTYSHLLYEFLDNNFEKETLQVFLLERGISESVEQFYQRAFDEVSRTVENSAARVVVEVPDTKSGEITIREELRRRIVIHVRLHGLEGILQRKVHKTFDIAKLMSELRFVSKADYISAPSKQAQIDTSKLIEIEDCILYPNPIAPPLEGKGSKAHCNFSERKCDFGFVGKLSDVKGRKLLATIERNFGIFKKLGKRDNYQLSCENKTVVEFLINCRIIVIPSLYETFSYVLYEALRCGCRVVVSNRIPVPKNSRSGLEEKVQVVNGFRSNEWVKAMRMCLNANDSRVAFDYKVLYDEVSDKIGKFYWQILRLPTVNKAFSSRRIKISYINAVYWNLKMKLNRITRSFLGFFIKFVNKPYKLIKKSLRINRKETIQTAKNNPIPLKLPSVEIKEVDKKQPVASFDIKCKRGKLKFSDPWKAEAKVIYQGIEITNLTKDNLIIFNNSGVIDRVLERCKNIQSSNKVTQFKEKNLFIAEFNECNSDLDASQLFMTIAKELRLVLGNFRFMLFSDPKSKLFEAFRMCSTRCNVICIISKKESLIRITPNNVDFLIIEKSLLPELERADDYRNITCYDQSSSDSLPNAVVDLLRRISSKDFNMFVPVFFQKLEDSQNLNVTKYRDYDLITRISWINTDKTDISSHNSFDRLSNDIRVTDLFVREEIFLRYSSLIMNAKMSGSWVKFLSTASRDGCRIGGLI